MKVHIGVRIKEVIRNKNISVSEFAKEINYSRRNIYSIFTKESIDTNLLNKISKSLDHNFFAELSATTSQPSVVEEPNGQNTYYQNIISKLNQQVESLEKENSYLKEINKLLKGKLK
ncbi:MAG: helix-turn-helix domain-containing protein [Flavobacteriales bacterium]|nr:helix-turn-helix domain-containing protein [Flavobacteriales bacterium]